MSKDAFGVLAIPKELQAEYKMEFRAVLYGVIVENMQRNEGNLDVEAVVNDVCERFLGKAHTEMFSEADRIRKTRMAIGESQQEFAKRIGTQQSRLSRAEKGLTQLGTKPMMKIREIESVIFPEGAPLYTQNVPFKLTRHGDDVEIRVDEIGEIVLPKSEIQKLKSDLNKVINENSEDHLFYSYSKRINKRGRPKGTTNNFDTKPSVSKGRKRYFEG